jgi:hypothetical protein
MNLFDPGEKEGQGLFFSPEKIARVRQRNADETQAELQHKQSQSDKKLQAAIARDEKAREAEEKKNARKLARQAAREEVAREKAEKQVVRQAERAQKAAETAKSKRDAAIAKAQRTQAKKATQKSGKSKKRSLNEDTSERPKKRARTRTSRGPITAHLTGLIS